jgi:cell division initiation protein
MALTPVQIRNVDLPKARLRGYRRRDVEELVEELADSLESARQERAQLADRLQELETEAATYRELEVVLRSTLVAAERAGEEMKDQAKRESDLIVQAARAESRRVTRESAAEKRRLEEDLSKIRARLTAAFEMLGEWPGGESTKSEEAASATEPTALGEALDGGIRSLTRHDATSEAGS